MSSTFRGAILTSVIGCWCSSWVTSPVESYVVVLYRLVGAHCGRLRRWGAALLVTPQLIGTWVLELQNDWGSTTAEQAAVRRSGFSKTTPP